jgi:hypothetical protein
VQEENLGSRRKFVENYLLFTCITNKILALQPWSMGWRNLSKAVYIGKIGTYLEM